MEDHSSKYERENRKFAAVDESFILNKYADTPIPIAPSANKEGFLTVKKDKNDSIVGLFNTNKNPKLCKRRPFSLETVEKQFVKDVDLKRADDYQEYLIDGVLNPNGHTGINKGPIQHKDIDEDIDDVWVEDRTNYFALNKSRSNYNKKLAFTFSRNTRRHEREDALIDDSFDNQIRSFDPLDDHSIGRRYNKPEETHMTLQDQYDLVTESAIDDIYDIRNI
jgi:hypothetical protein